MPFAGLGTAAISGGASILSGLFGGKSAKTAAQQLKDSQTAAIANTNKVTQAGQGGVFAATGAGQTGVSDATAQGQRGIDTGVAAANSTLDQSREQQLQLLQPYLQSGTNSLSSLQQLAGAGGPLDKTFSFDPSNLQSDPGYAFTLQQGQQALQRSAAASGKLFSGGTLKSLAGYTTGTANQYFNDAFNRAQSTFNTNQNTALSRINTLQGLANLGFSGTTAANTAVGNTLGQSATNLTSGATQKANLGESGATFNAGLGEAGATTVADIGLKGNDTIAKALTNQGNAAAAGTEGASNSWLSALKGGTDAITNYLTKRTSTAPTNPAPNIPYGTFTGPQPSYTGLN